MLDRKPWVDMHHRSIRLIVELLILSGAVSSMPPAFSADIRKFCQENISVGRRPISKEYSGFGSDWVDLQFPSESSRRFVFDRMLDSPIFSGSTVKIGDLAFSSNSKNSLTLKSSMATNAIAMFDDIKAEKYAWLICGSFSPLDAFSCANAMKFDLSLIKANGAVLLPGLHNEILHDGQALRGFFLVADRIKKLVLSGDIPGSRLYEDFESAYRSIGCSHSAAKERAWKAMVLLATGGTETADHIRNHFGDDENSGPVRAAVTVITKGAEVLNARTSARGFLYSLPRAVPSSCDSGKSYHFWMPAYLAREAVKGGHPKNSSALAAYLLEVGYQMTGRTLGRDPARPFSVTWNDAGNQKIRIDLAYAAAGGIYGSRSNIEFSRSFSPDAALEALLSKSENLKPLPDSKATSFWENHPAKAFFRWKSLFAPAEGFEALLNSID